MSYSLDFPQKLLLADIIDPQRLPNTYNQSSLKVHDGEGWIQTLRSGDERAPKGGAFGGPPKKRAMEAQFRKRFVRRSV